MIKLTASLPLVLIAACASAPITSTVQASDPAAFAQARTFVLAGPPEGGIALDPKLRAAVESGLAEGLRRHGYAPAAGAADLRVDWRVAPMGRVSQDASSRPALEAHTPIGPGDPYAGYRAPAGADAGANAGMLLVTISNASGAVVWQATSEGMATGAASAVRGAGRAAKSAVAGAPKSTAR